MLKLLAIVMLIVLGAARPAYAIAYGETAEDGRYAFSTRLTMTGIPTEENGTRDSWCSGALIAPRWVITAGHCFRDAAGRHVSRTVADRTTATVGGQEIEVVAVVQAGGADVALARLAAEVTGVTPLRVGDTAPAEGEQVRLTGFGFADDQGTVPARMQTGQFVIDQVGEQLLQISGRAPRRATSACLHDSGGPYFRERRGGAPELVAVVSGGPACPHEGPDSSARTDTLAGWITATVTAAPGPDVPLIVVVAALGLLIVAGVVTGVRRWTAPAPGPRRGRHAGRVPQRTAV
ncbi:trypsin [Actinoplanes sp. SE50]|uniref:S1 family peptidase n=1 Tax=unclassified Actinoplanes TaxID=2626549 RepID=UPI00023EC28B|nr:MULTISPECIES: trypsin-like serine protease [unclassified Actinoplanes]AEV84104.1 Thrombin-like enzyme gussurobin [Actinoplanes sp. SE50/110]ATO82496.1 trypsin [Actinoplanes sp. SE50]SLL99903.1 trypsin [Actinoplanes sp. SE50/110]